MIVQHFGEMSLTSRLHAFIEIGPVVLNIIIFFHHIFMMHNALLDNL